MKGAMKRFFLRRYFLAFVRHFDFIVFWKDHHQGDRVMVGNVSYCFRFFQNWHTSGLCKADVLVPVAITLFLTLLNQVKS